MVGPLDLVWFWTPILDVESAVVYPNRFVLSLRCGVVEPHRRMNMMFINSRRTAPCARELKHHLREFIYDG